MRTRYSYIRAANEKRDCGLFRCVASSDFVELPDFFVFAPGCGDWMTTFPLVVLWCWLVVSSFHELYPYNLQLSLYVEFATEFSLPTLSYCRTEGEAVNVV